jgi:uncharacterized membrane protein
MASGPSEQLLVHFYRAVVAHMDVWRQRMDATTNWAAATAAGMITFAFGTPASPHFVLLLALAFQGVFLLMETRRYQMFDLWRRRFRVLNRYLVAPVLGAPREDVEKSEKALAELARDLGRTIPHERLLGAMGYRIRRNYGYLFLVTLVAWVLRLDMLAGAGSSLAEVVAQASIGVVPGVWVFSLVLLSAVVGSTLAMVAPSERMMDWVMMPPPLRRGPLSGRGE